MSLSMKARFTTLLAAALVAGVATRAAQAQTNYFGVEVDAETLGYPGCFTDSSYIPGGLSDSAVSDPAGYTYSSPTYGSAYVDVGAGSRAETARLHAWASAHINPVTGQSYPGSASYGYGYAHFYDRLTVTSDVLPAGTPVTLVFGNVIDIATWKYSGLYDGYIDMRLSIGSANAMSRWTASYLYGDTVADTPLVTVTTKVGAQLSVDGKLRVQARAMFYTRPTTTDINADATATLVLRQAPDGVTLVSASGIAYPLVPAN